LNLEAFSSLVYNLNAGLFNENMLARFKEKCLSIVKADCFCAIQIYPELLNPVLVFKSGCKETEWNMLMSFLRKEKDMPGSALKDFSVFTGKELPTLNLGHWQSFLFKVYHCFWDHSHPGHYLFGVIKLDHSLGIITFRRSLRHNPDFGSQDKEFLTSLCPHLDNFLRLRFLTTLWHKQGGIRDYFRAQGLTQRETEVAILILKGTSIKNISSQLKISEQTVRDHLKKIYLKMNIHSKSELLASFINLWEKEIQTVLDFPPRLK